MQGMQTRPNYRQLDPGDRARGWWVLAVRQLAIWLLLTFPSGAHASAAQPEDRPPMLLRPNTQQTSDRPSATPSLGASVDESTEVAASRPAARTARTLAPPSSKRIGQADSGSTPSGNAWATWSTSAATLLGLSLGMLWWWRRRQTAYHPPQYRLQADQNGIHRRGQGRPLGSHR